MGPYFGGAARVAYEKFGAGGVTEGLKGATYAIPVVRAGVDMVNLTSIPSWPLPVHTPSIVSGLPVSVAALPVFPMRRLLRFSLRLLRCRM